MGWPYPRSPFERRLVAKNLAHEDPERIARVGVAVLCVLARGPIASQRKLRAAVRTLLGKCTDGDVDAAVELCEDYVDRTTGPRGATRYEIQAKSLPPQLHAYFSTPDR